MNIETTDDGALYCLINTKTAVRCKHFIGSGNVIITKFNPSNIYNSSDWKPLKVISYREFIAGHEDVQDAFETFLKSYINEKDKS